MFTSVFLVALFLVASVNGHGYLDPAKTKLSLRQTEAVRKAMEIASSMHDNDYEVLREFERQMTEGEQEKAWWDKIKGVYADIRAQSDLVTDTRFDMYGKIMAAVMAQQSASWKDNVPTSADVTPPVKPAEKIEKTTVGLITSVEVPVRDEHWDDVSDVEAFIIKDVFAQALSFPDSADECGEWGPDEDKVDTIVNQLHNSYCENRVLVEWFGEDNFNLDPYSDKVIGQIAFEGLGQHRVTKVRGERTVTFPNSDTPVTIPAHKYYGKTVTIEGKEISDIYYSVELEFARGLEVRDGFAKLGADAYFDRNGNVLFIERGGKLYSPDTKRVPREEKCENVNPICDFFANACRSPSWYCKAVCWQKCEVTEFKFGWEDAKLAWRGTLNAMVTAIDHLYGLHLAVGNSIVVANREVLDAQHPLRRLLTPFGYRTEAINYQAAIALCNEMGLIHRAYPLTKAGMEQAWEFARTKNSGLTFQNLKFRTEQRGVDTISLPLTVDGGEYYEILKKFTSAYLERHFDMNGDCKKCTDCVADDTSVETWWQTINDLSPNKDFPPLTCENMLNTITLFQYMVSGGHTHVGTIGSEIRDPCFMPWSWREGELCGPPRTNFIQQIVMVSTGIDQPKIKEDYSHLFLPGDKPLWKQLTEDLEAFKKRLDERNDDRYAKGKRRFKSFDIDYVETAVSV